VLSEETRFRWFSGEQSGFLRCKSAIWEAFLHDSCYTQLQRSFKAAGICKTRAALSCAGPGPVGSSSSGTSSIMACATVQSSCTRFDVTLWQASPGPFPGDPRPALPHVGYPNGTPFPTPTCPSAPILVRILSCLHLTCPHRESLHLGNAAPEPVRGGLSFLESVFQRKRLVWCSTNCQDQEMAGYCSGTVSGAQPRSPTC
jgi:hypothetical protein